MLCHSGHLFYSLEGLLSSPCCSTLCSCSSALLYYWWSARILLVPLLCFIAQFQASLSFFSAVSKWSVGLLYLCQPASTSYYQRRGLLNLHNIDYVCPVTIINHIDKQDIGNFNKNDSQHGVSDQRHILRDRRPGTAACPACWATGTKELK